MNLSESEKQRLLSRVDQIYDLIHGEGDKPGLKGRIDRLERAEALRKRLSWAVITASLTAVATVGTALVEKLIAAFRSSPHP